VPADAYPGLEKEVSAITYDTHLIADCDFDGDVVKAVLSAVADNIDTMASINKTMGQLTPEMMATDIGVPMHPAAEEFYRERGAM
jgi:hypothetical protein